MKKHAILLALACAMIIILCGSVSAADAPSASFTANTTNGVAPLSVHFMDKSTGNPTSWDWDFGDGQTSSVQNPTHTYSSVGAYSIKLTATNDAGSNSLTKKNYITAWNTSSPFKSNNGITFYVANDGGVKYDMPNGVNQQGDYQAIYVNNSYFISRGGGGMNPIQLSTDPTNKVGTKTTTTNQSGTFWVVFSGGIGHLDDAILMLAVNGTIPDDFAMHITSSGYTYTLPAPALSNPSTSSLTNVTYVTGALNETFCKNDFIYGPQSWKPTNTVNYPIFEGQDPSNNFSLMFIDLNVGGFGTNAYPGVTNGSIQVDYSFSNLESFAAFGAYGWFAACNWGTGIPMASNIAQSGFNVKGIPAASFTTNTTSGFAPLDVQFTDTSSNAPTSWAWDFNNDGIIDSTSQNPTWTYDTPGTYTVVLTASNLSGNNTITRIINVFNSTQPTVTATPDEGTYNSNKSVNLKSDQSDAIIYYTTDGTDPETSPTRVPYSDPIPIDNTTVLNFAAVNSGGVWSSRYSKKYIIDTSVPTVTATPAGGLYNSSKDVSLDTNDADTDTTTYYTTDGTDPQTSSTRSTYAGTITINTTTTLRYIAIDQANNWSPEYTQTYTIEPVPVADLTVNATKGVAPLDVQFSDKSTGNITGWYWDFGDGSSSTDENPTHTYTNPGTYTVVLTVMGPGGNDIKTLTNYIKVNYPTPIADFGVNTTSGTAPLDVQFTDKSTGDVTSWYWDFGDGSSSTDENPTHTYNAPGRYTVTFTVNGLGGDNSKIQTNYITVNYPTPIAGFTTNTTSGTAPLQVKFTDGSTNNPTSWNWEFGDGTTSTEQNPIHKYSSAGTFIVKLTVTGHGGSSTKTSNITVKAPDTTKPTATASLDGGIYNTNKSVTLSMNENGSIYFTTNGTTPTKASKKYSGQISVTSTTNLKFIAIDLAGNMSNVYSKTYTIDKTAPTVSVSLNSGLYKTNKFVTLTMSEKGTIYYTTNGITPTKTSKKYSGPISITATTHLMFMALDMAGNTSPVYSKTYTIDKSTPKVTSTNPKDGVANVSTTSTISVKFSENIKSSDNWSKIYIKNLTTGLLVSINTSIYKNVLNIKMAKTRYTSNVYQVYIPKLAVEDKAGNKLATAYTFKFKT